VNNKEDEVSDKGLLTLRLGMIYTICS